MQPRFHASIHPARHRDLEAFGKPEYAGFSPWCRSSLAGKEIDEQNQFSNIVSAGQKVLPSTRGKPSAVVRDLRLGSRGDCHVMFASEPLSDKLFGFLGSTSTQEMCQYH